MRVSYSGLINHRLIRTLTRASILCHLYMLKLLKLKLIVQVITKKPAISQNSVYCCKLERRGRGLKLYLAREGLRTFLLYPFQITMRSLFFPSRVVLTLVFRSLLKRAVIFVPATVGNNSSEAEKG